jgi:hypothetical protein
MLSGSVPATPPARLGPCRRSVTDVLHTPTSNRWVVVVGDGSCEIEVTRAGFKTVAGPGRNSPTPVPRQRHLSREWRRACGVGRPLAPQRAQNARRGPRNSGHRESFETADHHPGARGGAPHFHPSAQTTRAGGPEEPRAVSRRHGFSARGRSGAATGRTRALVGRRRLRD